MGTGHAMTSVDAERRLWLTIGVAIAIALMEFIGGMIGQSLALVSDSGHVFTDILALGLSIFGIRLARRPHTARWTFGYHRAEIFAALVNGSALIAVALVILYEAYARFLHPVQVQATLVLAVASLGLVGNISMGLTLVYGGGSRMSLNIRASFLHVMSDALSSVGVIISGLVVIFTGYLAADPFVAILISGLILRNAYSLVKESANILMEATPRHLELERVARTVQGVQGVRSIHDLHIWTISSGLYALSGHLVVETKTLEEGTEIIREVSKRVKDTFGIEHVTLQLERQVLEDIERPSGQTG